MPATRIVVYWNGNSCPVVDQYRKALRENRRLAVKLLSAVQHLETYGFDARRPQVDVLRDGIWEFRIRIGSENWRLLYFFAGKNLVVLSHVITKEREVPPKEIDLAKLRREQVEQEFEKFTKRLSQSGWGGGT